MRSVFYWLVSILAVAFWVFRVVVTIMATVNINFIIIPSDLNVEIALLFLTLPCLILVFKRNIIGAILYFGLYAWYFGGELIVIIKSLIENSVQILPASTIIAALVGISAIFISFLVLIDAILAIITKGNGGNKKSEWFYGNKNFDRKLDDRADKNNYRIY